MRCVRDVRIRRAGAAHRGVPTHERWLVLSIDRARRSPVQRFYFGQNSKDVAASKEFATAIAFAGGHRREAATHWQIDALKSSLMHPRTHFGFLWMVDKSAPRS